MWHGRLCRAMLRQASLRLTHPRAPTGLFKLWVSAPEGIDLSLHDVALMEGERRVAVTQTTAVDGGYELALDLGALSQPCWLHVRYHGPVVVRPGQGRHNLIVGMSIGTAG